MKTVLFGVAVVLVIAVGFLFAFKTLENNGETLSITNFDECAAAGYPIMESYPEQCMTPDGRNFVNERQTLSPEEGMTFNGCAVAGCSGTLCVSADEVGDIFTTCEYRPEYVCYKEASCEPQPDGKCGWTETAE